MTKHQDNPAAKQWIHLADDAKPFDQTNGAVDFDPGVAYDATNIERDLIEKAVVSNTISVGALGL